VRPPARHCDDHGVELDLVRWQFDFTWSLAELHLQELAPEDFLWEPARRCWTVRQAPDGSWAPDWEEPEPDPPPVPTIGWVSWHLGWWWTVTLDHLQGRVPHDRTAVAWPGPGAPTVAWLRALRTEWVAVLDRLTAADLRAAAPFPWPADAGLTVAHTLAWVNGELMKNVAELGQLRLQRAAAAG
jgi:hypothetical protein